MKPPAKKKPMTLAQYNDSPMDKAADKAAVTKINAMRKSGDSGAAKETKVSKEEHMKRAKRK